MQLPAGSAEPAGAARRARLKAAALPGSSGGGTNGRRITPHGRQKLPEHLPVERIALRRSAPFTSAASGWLALAVHNERRREVPLSKMLEATDDNDR
ncbi:hypothetical protein [Sorangium atrum]|uniref:Uncharacterized protein n=1 Tax=Sorangium atrum TaxID=2995308 RepID=A0ABT5BR63_9BACT|nr:hypothetical protein [Sorangium aterium]MDC0676188.1 hypothetical protein [Sorangium aterium]